jgi:hypothetical protein
MPESFHRAPHPPKHAPVVRRGALGRGWKPGQLSYPLDRILTEGELGQDVLTATQDLKTKLFKVVRASWTRDTSYGPDRWSDNNPA